MPVSFLKPSIAVPEPTLHETLSFGRHRFVEAREQIYVPGAENDHFTILVSGIACRIQTLPDRSRAIVGFILPGDFTSPYVSEPMRMDFGVTSLAAGEIITIPNVELWARARNTPTLSQALARSAILDGAIARAWMTNISRRPADKRAAHLLCELRYRLARAGIASRNGFPLPLLQQDLADALGLSAVHANRVLQSLRKRGLASFRNHQILIPDLSAFEQFAEFNPDYLNYRNIEEI